MPSPFHLGCGRNPRWTSLRQTPNKRLLNNECLHRYTTQEKIVRNHWIPWPRRHADVALNVDDVPAYIPTGPAPPLISSSIYLFNGLEDGGGVPGKASLILQPVLSYGKSGCLINPLHFGDWYLTPLPAPPHHPAPHHPAKANPAPTHLPECA